MEFGSEYRESQSLPRGLYIAYRLVTALVVLMLVAAGVCLIAVVLPSLLSLWDWGVLKAAGLRGLLACL